MGEKSRRHNPQCEIFRLSKVYITEILLKNGSSSKITVECLYYEDIKTALTGSVYTPSHKILETCYYIN